MPKNDVKYDLRGEAGRLEEYWSPKVLGQVNNQFVKVAKVKLSWRGINTMRKTKCFWCYKESWP